MPSASHAHRADHVGSFIRPDDLVERRAEHQAGRIDLAQLRTAEDRAILDVLELQRAAGLDVFTDGEFRRSGWHSAMAESVDGFVPAQVELEWFGPHPRRGPSSALVVGAPLRRKQRLTAAEVPFMIEHAPGDVKVTIPSPSVFMQLSYKRGVTDAFYPRRADLVQAFAGIVRDEIEAAIADGVRYVQLDCPQYSFYVDDRFRAQMRAEGENPDALLQDAIAGDNACLAGIDRTVVTIGLHVCRGNNRGNWFAEGGYDGIAENLFGSLNVDRFMLEYDTDRSGSFEPLRFIPAGKTAVLGLISTKSPALESSSDLAQRIDQASRYLPLDQLALSPQCGFASGVTGAAMTADDQRRKLDVLVNTAAAVWR